MNLIAIFAVVNITWAVVKIRPQKIQACTGFEPMTSAIPVPCFTNYPFSIKILKDPSPRGSRTSGSFPLPRIPFRISVCVTKKVSVVSLPLAISIMFLRSPKYSHVVSSKKRDTLYFFIFISFFHVLQPVRALTLSNEIA